MNAPLGDRLLAECVHLRPLGDPELDALRRALLAEDVLGVSITDRDMDLAVLSDPVALRGLPVTSLPRP